MTKAISEKIKKLQNDYQSGSREIAINGVEILNFAALEANFNIEDMHDIKKVVIQAKPDMAALKNACSEFLELLEKEGIEKSADIYADIKGKFKKSLQTTIENAREEILGNKYFSILTCSYSSTVLELFKTLSGEIGNLHITAAESVWNGTRYGQKFIAQCRENGINGSVVMDNHILNGVLQNQVCIIGADSVFQDGTAINGVPSAQTADLCKNVLPFYVVCESFKKKSGKPHKHTENQGFELIESNLIKKIISDGIFKIEKE